MPNSEEWMSYRRVVLAHMEKTEATLSRIENQLTTLRIKVAGIAAMVGCISGGIVSLLVRTLI